MGQKAFGNCYYPSTPPDGVCTHYTATLAPHRLRPLLCGVEPYFAQLADNTGRIHACELSQIWQQCARRKLGELCKEDLQTIYLGVDSYMEAKNITPTTRVNYADFMSFLLDGTDGYMYDGSLISRLRLSLTQNPQNFHELLLACAKRARGASSRGTEKKQAIDVDAVHTTEELRAAGINAINEDRIQEAEAATETGVDLEPLDNIGVSLVEFARCLEELIPARCGDVVDYPASISPFELAASIFRVLGTPQDGRLDLYTALAYIMDRRKTPVELVLYDISYGASRLFSPVLLGQRFEAIYHSSVLVFGTEFWYGGQIFENEPPIDPHTFGPPMSDALEQLKPSVYNKELKVVHLGSTLLTLYELREFLHKQMKSKFRQNNYDVLTHNCSHFTDDVVQFLTGKGIPDAVRRLPELVMDTPGAQLLRPFLNRWLGYFESDNNKNGLKLEFKDDDSDSEFRVWDEAATPGTSTIDLGYFDPTERDQITRKSKRRDSIKREENGRLTRPKSGENVEFKLPRLDDKQERKEIRRTAIRRLVDGRFVHARIV